MMRVVVTAKVSLSRNVASAHVPTFATNAATMNSTSATPNRSDRMRLIRATMTR